MMNERLNRGVFAPKGASQNVGFTKKKEVLFVRKIYAARSEQGRSIAPSALKCSPIVLNRACLCSSILNHSIFPQHSNESDGAWATQDLGCMWRALDHNLLASSIDVLESIMLGSITGALDRRIRVLERTNRD
jgi:hypothetical protein